MFVTYDATTSKISFGSTANNLLTSAAEVSVTVKIGVKSIIDSSSLTFHDLTFKLEHECKDIVATPITTSIPIKYTLGTGSKSYSLDTAFTYSSGTVADYCFTYSIYDDPAGVKPAYFQSLTPSSVSPTPTRISGVTSVLFNYAAGMLPNSSDTGDLAYQVKATSILTTVTSVLAPISVNFYHECYYARLSSSPLTEVISTISGVFTVGYSGTY